MDQGSRAESRNRPSQMETGYMFKVALQSMGKG